MQLERQYCRYLTILAADDHSSSWHLGDLFGVHSHLQYVQIKEVTLNGAASAA